VADPVQLIEKHDDVRRPRRLGASRSQAARDRLTAVRGPSPPGWRSGQIRKRQVQTIGGDGIGVQTTFTAEVYSMMA
jgi:hypothetical protein